MRAVIQRVSSARVEVDGEITGAIERGLLVYLGVGIGDGPKDRAYLLDKILNARIFENLEGKFDRSVLDVGGELLVVSQFTLYGDLRRGRRPSFDGALRPEEAEAMYEAFVHEARARGVGVATGRFRAHMHVSSVNDGPVTLWLDTAKAAD
ncbi:D-aminoacyl-tRNA deacylase [Pendulispora albinea]|uniref:D-aminoacyl-tRNA deacylase n=1 Tax=Pendulispora albinea TaxID=2741071 RepID=A0ABZ2LUG0_9BACT